MRLFGFRGGVHPEALKQHSADRKITRLPMPKQLFIPLQQHVGEPAEPEVSQGDKVYKGQLLARSQGLISAPVHAPTSGTIVAVGEHPAPHPSGLPVRTIILESDGKDQRQQLEQPAIDPFTLSPDEIALRVGNAGIVGMGGATFPSAIKLGQSQQYPIHTLIVNGSECEPYLTCDDRLMRERPADIIDGVRLTAYALQANRATIAIEDNKPEAYAALRSAAMRNAAVHTSVISGSANKLRMTDKSISSAGDVSVEVIKVPSRYPMGWDKQLIRIITGQEVPKGERTASIGVCVHNVGTIYAVHRALRYGSPLLSRIITVAGGAIHQPQNIEVPIGARVSDVIDFCGGLISKPARLLMGGPMMGQVIPHDQVPLVKGSSAVLALTKKEIDDGPERPCIRCGRCVQACPVGLMPVEMAARLRVDDIDGAQNYGVQDCIGCSCCSYVCPSKIPLVHYFNYAKGALDRRESTSQKMQQTKEMALARQLRLDQQAAAREAKKASKKAARSNKNAENPEPQQSARLIPVIQGDSEIQPDSEKQKQEVP